MDSTWWAVALSEEVTGDKPLSVDIGDRPVVLWRDLKGHVRALEDRCPHRRAPLSLGCIRKEGWIQCGYHGWSYDGETGRVTEIPNLKNEQRFSAVYRAERFAVHEAAGFVRVSLNVNAVPPPLAAPDIPPLSGTAHVALDHERYLAALLDDPGLVLTIFGVHFTPYLMAELHEHHGQLVMERSCQWTLPHWPAAFLSEYPLNLISCTDPVSGETTLTLNNRDFTELLSVRLAPVPAGRGVTAVRWRAVPGAGLGSVPRRLLGWFDPIRVHSTIDGAALRKLKPSVSVVFEELRRPHLSPLEQIVA
jgi:nitrite reductase/ring-hydroxylating ferredoxin subunit